MGTDPEFARRMAEHEPEPEQREAGQHIEELQRRTVANLVNLLALGLMVHLVQGEEVDLDGVLRLVHEGIDARK